MPRLDLSWMKGRTWGGHAAPRSSDTGAATNLPPTPPSTAMTKYMFLTAYGAPYLTWVKEDLRLQTRYQEELPRASGRKHKILLMSGTLMTGGAEAFAVNTAKIMNAAGHEVHLWVDIPGEYRLADGFEVLTGDPSEHVNRLGIDTVIFNNGAAIWKATQVRRNTTAKLGLCVHGLVRWTVDQFTQCKDDVHALDFAWGFSRACGGMKQVGLIPESMPCYQLSCPVDDEGLPFTERDWSGEINVGYVGRCSPEKDLSALAKLWYRLHLMSDGRLRFHFVGGLDPSRCSDPQYTAWLGPVIDRRNATEEWQQLLEAGVLTDHGHLSQNDTHAVVRGLHFMTLTSEFEGQPVVFTEAQASGAICVMRRVGEVGEQLGDGGVLVQPTSRMISDDSITSMAKSVMALLQDESECRRMAEEGRRIFDARHAPAAWLSNVEAMLEEVHGGTRTA